jgi:signal transduction histidine kinase
VLDNLLDNVANHAGPESEVRISAVHEGDTVRVRVEDTGPGVPPDALPHLFEKFYRVPARPGSARHGTGLGLALVKGLAEAMGGSAAASASGLGGLAIDVSLPVPGGLPS